MRSAIDECSRPQNWQCNNETGYRQRPVEDPIRSLNQQRDNNAFLEHHDFGLISSIHSAPFDLLVIFMTKVFGDVCNKYVIPASTGPHGVALFVCSDVASGLTLLPHNLISQ